MKKYETTNEMKIQFKIVLGNKKYIKERKSESVLLQLFLLRKHDYIILTPLNPIFI